MMSELFDEEYLQRQFMISEREKNRAEGRAEGRAEERVRVFTEMASKLLEMGEMSKEKIAELTGLPMEKIDELSAQLQPAH